MIELKPLQNNLIKNLMMFFFSFSVEDDDAAQWERYADNGEGVCLVTSIPNILGGKI